MVEKVKEWEQTWKFVLSYAWISLKEGVDLSQQMLPLWRRRRDDRASLIVLYKCKDSLGSSSNYCGCKLGLPFFYYRSSPFLAWLFRWKRLKKCGWQLSSACFGRFSAKETKLLLMMGLVWPKWWNSLPSIIFGFSQICTLSRGLIVCWISFRFIWEWVFGGYRCGFLDCFLVGIVVGWWVALVSFCP